MGDTIFNGNGDDFRVFESGGTPEGFICYAGPGKDGPWTRIGSGTGTTAFDLSSATGGSISKTRYLKIVDDGNGPSSGTDLGFDLDGVEMITPPLLVDFTATSTNTCVPATVGFTDRSIGNPVTWNWLFPEGTPASSTEQNPSNIVYQTPGIYDVSLTISNGISSSTKLKTGLIRVNLLPVVDLGNDTTINASASILLNAGNPGSYYLWSTGDTTQTILVDSTGVGLGTKNYSVLVSDSNNCSASDTIRITFSQLTNIRENEFRDALTIYPNPTNGIIHITTPCSKADYILLITPLGRQVFEKIISPGETNISLDLTGFPEGIYFFEIAGKEKQYFEKIIIR
jgi:PKD repeat protein